MSDNNSDRKTLLQSLLDAAAWPHPVDGLRILETHISWVLLTGEYAYKIKKPIKLEFLDFSTLELRHRWCKEELRLNSRWAPQLYIDVVPIAGTVNRPEVGGGGAPIEYAVRMRQFPQSALLNARLAEGLVDAGDMLELADMIADRHTNAPVHFEERFGSPAAITKPMRENFPYIGEWLDADTLARLQRWTDAELDRFAPVIERRLEDGFVRECHGDLHLRNLVQLDDGIVAFDCVEFSDALRMLDVISDITFLTMDLVANGRADLARTALNRYLEVTGDYEGMQLYGLYFVYHCMIRAKVDAIRATERGDADARGRQTDLESMHHYCDVAARWIDRPSPALIVMHGLSGSGKTWVSSRLLQSLYAVRIRSDIERKRLHGYAERASSESSPGQGLYAADKSAATHRRMLELAEKLLRSGQRVILDATFLKAAQRAGALSLAAECGVPCIIVHIDAPIDVLRSRIEARRASADDASEASVDVLDYQLEHADPLNPAAEGPIVSFDSDGNPDDLVRDVEKFIG